MKETKIYINKKELKMKTKILNFCTKYGFIISLTALFTLFISEIFHIQKWLIIISWIFVALFFLSYCFSYFVNNKNDK